MHRLQDVRIIRRVRGARSQTTCGLPKNPHACLPVRGEPDFTAMYGDVAKTSTVALLRSMLYKKKKPSTPFSVEGFLVAEEGLEPTTSGL